jgi:hypothetical protein
MECEFKFTTPRRPVPAGAARCLMLALSALIAGEHGFGAERFESFDRDPNWESRNSRSARPEIIRQEFGWSATTTNAGGAPGEVGGLISPAAEPAFYAKQLPTLTFNDRLAASGTLRLEKGGGHTLIGFFNDATLNEWRTPNTMVLRINQRGDTFHCHFEYCTSKWRAGAGIIGKYDKEADRMHAVELPAGRAYEWSLVYEPDGAQGRGQITVTFGGITASCELTEGHKADGAKFNRFGIVNVMKQYDGAGRLWLDNVTVNGAREEFSRDPGWEGSGNRRTYETRNVRPRFDFGFSPTHFAGGKSAGEMGGLFFRGDCRYPERLAAYGDRLMPLTLERPLRARGKVTLRRGVSDSTTIIGFYHSAHSLEVNPSQDLGMPQDFLGAAIEGPSREGFYFYPVYRNHGRGASSGVAANAPRIFPDGAIHDWTLEYDPAAAEGRGRITVALDGRAASIDLAPGDKLADAHFDRFGLVTPWIDGNGQYVYFDDLHYTASQE